MEGIGRSRQGADRPQNGSGLAPWARLGWAWGECMAEPKNWRNALSYRGWNLEAESLWTESGPGRLWASFIFSWVVTASTLGHHAVRARWPWAASMGVTVGVTLVLAMTLWCYWLLIRRTRKALVPALRRGEKERFRPGPLYRWRLWFAGSLGFILAQQHFQWPFELLILFTWPWAMIHGIEAFNAYRETARLGFDLREEALRSKLAPHFIFNTLNTLHAQIDEDPQGAQSTTEKLAQLFREVLAVADRPTIPLKEELSFVESYLGIEQARLGDRLRVFIAVPEDLETAGIPPLSLQVMVENAIKHGVAPMEQGGEVRIGAEREDRVLHLWVEDPGTGDSPEKGTGTALETLRQRLDRPEDLGMGMVDGRHRVGFRWSLA
jgi:Histidine kinase